MRGIPQDIIPDVKDMCIGGLFRSVWSDIDGFHWF